MYFPSSCLKRRCQEHCSGNRWDISAEMRPAETTKVLFVCLTCGIHTKRGDNLNVDEWWCKVWVDGCLEGKTKLAASLFQLFKAELNNISSISIGSNFFTICDRSWQWRLTFLSLANFYHIFLIYSACRLLRLYCYVSIMFWLLALLPVVKTPFKVKRCLTHYLWTCASEKQILTKVTFQSVLGLFWSSVVQQTY